MATATSKSELKGPGTLLATVKPIHTDCIWTASPTANRRSADREGSTHFMVTGTSSSMPTLAVLRRDQLYIHVAIHYR